MADPTFWFAMYLIIAVTWVTQFASFMLLDNKTFPGFYDKWIWAAAFLLAFPLAPFAFMVWKSAFKSYVQAERASGEGVKPGSV